MSKVFAVCIVQSGDKVLLGYKKIKLGKGFWNGFGGKVEKGETFMEAAIRELDEEAGLQAESIEDRGVVRVSFCDSGDDVIFYIFHVLQFSGMPIETREMRPQWFNIDSIPYDDMWPDDRYWLPLILDGKTVNFQVVMDSMEGRKMISCETV